MKTVQNVASGELKRLTDAKAADAVATKLWVYVPKRLWKALKTK